MNYDDIVEIDDQRLLIFRFYQQVKIACLIPNSQWSRIKLDELAEKYSSEIHGLNSVLSGEKTFPECMSALARARVRLLAPKIKILAAIYFAVGGASGCIGAYLLYRAPFFLEFSPGLALLIFSFVCCFGTVWSFYRSMRQLQNDVSEEAVMAEELQEIYFPRFHD